MPYQQSSGGKIVVLNDFPGAGKFTILKHTKELLPANKTRLLDNHLLIDPVQAIYPDRQSTEHHELRLKLRELVFESLSKLAQEGHVVLMTASLADDDEMDEAVFQEHLAMVRGPCSGSMRTATRRSWRSASGAGSVVNQRRRS